jgi:hypothetical protein
MKKGTSGTNVRRPGASRPAVVLGLVLALCLIAGSATPLHAQEQPPPLPHIFSGTVTVGGRPAAEGTLVEAFLDDIKQRETTVNHQGRYSLHVEGPGTTVTFYVGGVLANETATWETGKIEELNLTAARPPSSWGICFIATAAFGSPTAREVQVMVQFWYQYILTNPLGRGLAYIYGRVGPPIAGLIYDHAYLKPVVRAVMWPLVVISTVGVNTAATGKAAIAGLLALVLVALAAWATRRRGRRTVDGRA